jgi:hypothetical protein
MQKIGRIPKKKAIYCQELINLKIVVDETRKKIDQDLQAILKTIDRLSPDLEETRCQKLQNYLPQDWRNYLA